MNKSSSNESDNGSSNNENLVSGYSLFNHMENDDEQILTHDLFPEFLKYSSSDSDSDISSSNGECNLKDQLKRLFISYPNVPHSFMKDLLSILKVFHPFLPEDPRVLMATERAPKHLKSVEPGKYYHVGICSGIRSILDEVEIHQKTLTLQFNIDGLPPFKSNVKCFWPILCFVKEIPNSVYIVGIYFGDRKPDSSDEMLRDFINELTEVVREGVLVKDNALRVFVDGFCCDTPARSFIKCTKSHTGYYGCDRCVQRGIHINNRMTFPENDAPRRTNASFRTHEQEEHHHQSPVIEEIQDIDMIRMFPNDYMHSVCKGVVTTLLQFLRTGPLSHRLSHRQIEEMSSNLLSLRPYITCDFARRPRSLRHLSMWKATESRLFCMYLAPVILKPFVNEDFYVLFMTLTLLLRIISHPDLVHSHHDYCKVLVRTFLTQFSEVFGTEYLTYNFHSLVHLIEDCNDRGVVDNFSCFRYESFLYKLKRHIRSSHLPLEQIINRISERGPTLGVVENNLLEYCKYSNEIEPVDSCRVVRGESVKYFRKFTVKGTVLVAHSPDGYVMIKDNHVLRIKYFVRTGYGCLLIGDEYSTSEFLDFPLLSLTHVQIISSLKKRSSLVPFSQIKCKLLCIPNKNKCVVMPIQHTCTLASSHSS